MTREFSSTLTSAAPPGLRHLVPALCFVAVSALGAQDSAIVRARVTGFATIQGVVVDSLHSTPLAGAFVYLDGVAQMAQTGADGRFRLDSIPPGNYMVVLSHPLLDTLGVSLPPRSVVLTAGQTATVDLAVPSSDRIVSVLCPRPTPDARGPGALVGQVRDPDSGAPAVGARVQLVYEESDPLGLGKVSRVREAPVDAGGFYRICSLPVPMKGTVQVIRNGITSGEVPVDIAHGSLALRSLTVGAATRVTIAGAAGAPSTQVLRGNSRVVGQVVDKQGRPVDGARVTVLGSGMVTLTKTTGAFALDSLATGTQMLEVRSISFGVTDQAFEVTPTVATVRVTMNDLVPTLATVRVDASIDRGLSDVGYFSRKKSGMGFYMDSSNLRTSSTLFSDAMRGAPGLKFEPVGDGHYVIEPSREPMLGCVNYIVDGIRWIVMTPGDIDGFLRPSELRAVEVYSGATTPSQFQMPGQTKCTTIVIWTAQTTNRARKK